MFEAGIQVRQRHKAPHHQPATDQQDRSQSNLREYQDASRTICGRAVSGPHALFEVRVEVVARGGQRRYQAGQDTRSRRYHKRESKRSQVDSGARRLPHAFRSERRQ
jgi:hypothetical protein